LNNRLDGIDGKYGTKGIHQAMIDKNLGLSLFSNIRACTAAPNQGLFVFSVLDLAGTVRAGAASNQSIKLFVQPLLAAKTGGSIRLPLSFLLG
jgi:hypothetical protein